MPSKRDKFLIVFNDEALAKLKSDAEKEGQPVQEVVRKIVNRHYKLKDAEQIVRGRPRKQGMQGDGSEAGNLEG